MEIILKPRNVRQLAHLLRKHRIPLDTWGNKRKRLERLRKLFQEIKNKTVILCIDEGRIFKKTSAICIEVFDRINDNLFHRLTEEYYDPGDRQHHHSEERTGLYVKIPTDKNVDQFAHQMLKKLLGRNHLRITRLAQDMPGKIDSESTPHVFSKRKVTVFCCIIPKSLHRPHYRITLDDRTAVYNWSPCQWPWPKVKY